MLKLASKLSQVKEKCCLQGRRYGIGDILVSLLFAKLCGCDSLLCCHRFLCSLSKKNKRLLGFFNAIPCVKTFERRLKQVDADTLERLSSQLMEWLSHDKEGKSLYQQLCIDGKAIRSSRNKGGRCYHTLNVYDSERSVVQGHSVSSQGAGEVEAAIRILSDMDLTNRIITGDAMFASHRLCETIVQQGGHYLFYAKANQTILHRNIEKLFRIYPWPEALSSAKSQNKKHGRKEERQVRVMVPPLNMEKYRFGSVKHIAHIERKRYCYRGKKIIERSLVDEYLITNLPAAPDLPQSILHYNRQHWAVENHCHRHKDTVLNEDAYSFRHETMLRTMVSINNIAYSFLMNYQKNAKKHMPLKAITQLFTQKNHKLETFLKKIVPPQRQAITAL